jgi:hypothetical protein
MASNTRETWKRRTRRKAKAGRKRKNQEARHSTPSSAQLFAGMGEPGQAAPKAPAKVIKSPPKAPTTSGAAAR